MAIDETTKQLLTFFSLIGLLVGSPRKTVMKRLSLPYRMSELLPSTAMRLSTKSARFVRLARKRSVLVLV